MPTRDPLGAAWLVLSGLLLGAALTLLAMQPEAPRTAAVVDAGVDAPRSMVATPGRARLASGPALAIDCAAAEGFVDGCQ